MDSDSDDLDGLIPNQRNTTRENSESEESVNYNSEASFNSIVEENFEDEDRLPDLIREDEGPEPREC